MKPFIIIVLFSVLFSDATNLEPFNEIKPMKIANILLSGGGTRAAIGSAGVLKFLTSESKIFPFLGSITGISGGSWGMKMMFDSEFDIDKLELSLRSECRRRGQIGAFENFHEVKCKSEQCHSQWTDSIIKIFGEITPSPFSKSTSWYWEHMKRVKDGTGPMPIVSVIEFKCPFMGATTKKKEDCLGNDCVFTSNMFCAKEDIGRVDELTISGLNRNMGTWDTFSFSSAAWTAAKLWSSDNSMPPKIKDKKGKEYSVADGGFGCNLAFHTMDYIKGMYLAFDFSDNSKKVGYWGYRKKVSFLLEEFNNCVKHHKLEVIHQQNYCGSLKTLAWAVSFESQDCDEYFSNLLISNIMIRDHDNHERRVVYFPMRGIYVDIMTKFPTVTSSYGINYIKDCGDINSIIDELSIVYNIGWIIVNEPGNIKEGKFLYHMKHKHGEWLFKTADEAIKKYPKYLSMLKGEPQVTKIENNKFGIRDDFNVGLKSNKVKDPRKMKESPI